MIACAEICRTSAHFMLINTPHHKHTCKECAEICEECAKDCERLGDMQQCVDGLQTLRRELPGYGFRRSAYSRASKAGIKKTPRAT